MDHDIWEVMSDGEAEALVTLAAAARIVLESGRLNMRNTLILFNALDTFGVGYDR